MNTDIFITDSGRHLLALALEGKELKFTRAQIGDGELPAGASPRTMDSLVSPKKELPIRNIHASRTGICEISTDITNEGVSKGFWIREYGLFAEDPESGDEVLYAYCNKGNEAGYLEAKYGNNPVSFSLTIATVIDSAQNVTAVVNTVNNYITDARLEERVEDLFADAPDTAGFWTYGRNSEGRLTPRSLKEVRTLITGNADFETVQSRILSLEDNLADVILELEANGIFAESGRLITEDFRKINQADSFSCSITSIVAGDDSLDCAPAKGIIPGGTYTVSDGLRAENVQVRSVNIENGIQRVILTDTIKNTYALETAKLFRSTAFVSEAGAQGAKPELSYTWMPELSWTGLPKDYLVSKTVALTCGNSHSFILSGGAGFSPSGGLTLAADRGTSGVCISKQGYGMNCTQASFVRRVSTSYSQPANTKIFFAFNTGGEWFSLNDDGTANNFSANTPDYSMLASFGNSPEQIEKLTSIPAFAGKLVRFAVGLYSARPSSYAPLTRLGYTFLSDTERLSAQEFSPVFSLGDSGVIVSAVPSVHAEQGTAVHVMARYAGADGNFSDWQELASLPGTEASSVQFRADFSAMEANAGTASLDSVKLVWTDRENPPAGSNDAYLYTVTGSWNRTIRNCRVTVRHSPLPQADASLSCSVSVRKTPVSVHDEFLGTGNGTKQTFQLANRDGIRYDSASLAFDGITVSEGWELNTERGRITCTPPAGASVTCSYEYGWEPEHWTEMPLTVQRDYHTYMLSEFSLDFSFDDDAERTVGALRFTLSADSGKDCRQYLGRASGRPQAFALSHPITAGELSVTASLTDGQDGSNELDASSFCVSEGNSGINVSAPGNTPLYAVYGWKENAPEIYKFTAVFS